MNTHECIERNKVRIFLLWLKLEKVNTLSFIIHVLKIMEFVRCYGQKLVFVRKNLCTVVAQIMK